MRTIKTIFWLVVAALLIAFTYLNPDKITVHIWPGVPGISVDTKASALLIGSLLIGFLPTWLVLRATRWRLSRRIATLEATLAAQSHAINTQAPHGITDPTAIPGDLG